jgi:DNA-binding CsgD family transcriptional regulator
LGLDFGLGLCDNARTRRRKRGYGGFVAEEKGLSDRERQILRLVATGVSNKEIARQLVISTNTVKVHLRNIFAKIGVMSRTEATLYAIREGLAQVGEARSAEPPVSGESVNQGGAGAAVAGDQVGPAPGSSGMGDRGGRRRLMAAAVLAAVALLLVMTGVWAGASLGPQATVTPTVEVVNSTPAAVAAPSRWRLRASMPTARAGLGAAVYDGRIYAIAGEAASGPTGANERYDPADDSWTALAAKPVAAADVSAAMVGGRIYVPGGRLASGAVTSTLEVYDPMRDAWEQRASLPLALSAYAMVAFEGRLYVFGGWDGSGYRAETYEYDPGRDAWAVRTPMPTARGFAGAALAGGRIYVVGGKSAGERAVAANEEFMPSREGSGASAWLPRADLPESWAATAAAGLADSVYVLGLAPGGTAGLLRYYPAQNLWQALEAPPSPRPAAAALAALSTSLVALGGSAEGRPQVSNASYQAIYTIVVPVGP